MDIEYAIRLKWFRQFKQEIKAGAPILIVGIDIAKSKHHGFFGTPDGRTIRRRLIFDNTKDGFETLLFEANRMIGENELEDVVFGIEPTSVYHKPLAEYLIREGYSVVYTTNNAIKKNRALLDGRWDKNDTKDAANVADLVSRGKCHFYDYPHRHYRDIRGLLSLRQRLKKQAQRYHLRIRNNLVAQYFPELDRQWFSCYQENLAIVRWFLSPAEICQTPFEEFFRRVCGKHKGLRQRQRLRQVWEVSSASIGCEYTAAPAFEATVLIESLLQCQRQIQQVESLLYEICESFEEYALLQSIPGFGPYISAAVLGGIGDADRFENRKQVLRLAGLDLGAHRSGKTSRTAVPVISKIGKSELRYALYQAAKIATTRTQEMRVYFERLVKGREREKGIITKMRVKVSAKLLVIAWTMMKRKERYRPGLLFLGEPVQQR
jgi:transposase